MDAAQMSFVKPGNPWDRISDLASRLKVNPHVKGSPTTILALGKDGNSYDVFDVASAFLDAMDRKLGAPDDDFVEALRVIATMMKHGPSPKGGPWNATAHAIAWDRALVFMDRMEKKRGITIVGD
jgi:hypothetical protein